jgi:hypothetical protein
MFDFKFFTMEKNDLSSKKLAGPTTDYKTKKQQQVKGKDFDFDKEFAKGFSIDEAKAEMCRRIKLWKWEK